MRGRKMSDFAQKLSELSMDLYDIDDGATMEITADNLTINIFEFTIMLALSNGTITFEECTTADLEDTNKNLEDFDTFFKIMQLLYSYLGGIEK